MAERVPGGGEAVHAVLRALWVVAERQPDVVVETIARRGDRSGRDADAVRSRDLGEGERAAVRQPDPQAQSAGRPAPGPAFESGEQRLHAIELAPYLVAATRGRRVELVEEFERDGLRHQRRA